MKREGAGVNSAPTIVLVGGRLTLDDGSQVDSRQPMNDAATARAVRRALVSSPDWWTAVVSIVIPTLDDADGGFAFTDQKTIERASPDGTMRRSMFPHYPRATGGDDYIYNWRSLGETATYDRTTKPTRLERVKRRHAEMLEQRRQRDARIRIDTDGHFVHNLRSSSRAGDTALGHGTQLIIVPDTAEMRERVQALLDGTRVPEGELAVQKGWKDPYRNLRLGVTRASCRVTGLVRAGKWEDSSDLEAARLLLQERFDLKVGLWDLALNPVLRSTVLEPSPVSKAPNELAQAPARAKKRVELQAGGVERALYDGLAAAGWKLTNLDLGALLATGLHHPIVEGASKHPYLLVLVKRQSVRVLAWHWDYKKFDINAFVDSRRESFDRIALLPARKQFSGKVVRTPARYRKEGEIVYQRGRLMGDPKWVLLWSASKGWGDIDTDWSNISKQIFERTPLWVTLLADAVAQCLGIERRTLSLVDRSSE